ncbi:MAG: hypothetical protein J5927_00845 [Oscillospiraceae bacterium]|nr:hypothetical protein [Oscillospiraceae bacterium]
MKRFLVLLLCLSALTLCACAQQVQSRPGTLSHPAPLAASASSPAVSPQKEEMKDWRVFYRELLEDCAGDSKDPLDSYTLLDLDADGTPELLVKFGTCEADYHGRIFTVDAAVQELADMSLWNTGTYVVPGEPGLYLNCGHMGYHRLDRILREDDDVASECLLEEDLQSSPQTEYTPVDQVVPGARYLSLFPGAALLPLSCYEQILACLDGSAPQAETASPPQGDGDFYARLLREDVEVHTVAADAFVRSPGIVPLSRLGAAGVSYPYMRSDAALVRQELADLDGDGQEECLLYYRMPGSTWDDFRVILSAQESGIYAYLSSGPAETEVDASGLLIHRYGDACSARRFFFQGEDCFFLTVPCPAT